MNELIEIHRKMFDEEENTHIPNVIYGSILYSTVENVSRLLFLINIKLIFSEFLLTY